MTTITVHDATTGDQIAAHTEENEAKCLQWAQDQFGDYLCLFDLSFN